MTTSPKILLSSFPNSIFRDAFLNKIQSLGGILLDLNHSQFNNECTHVIVFSDDAKPTERILAALAAGLWIVCATWVEASFKNGAWLPEEPYECKLGGGLPRYHRHRAKNASSSEPLNKQPRRGSIECISVEQKKRGGGIFDGWTMCIQVQTPSANRSFRRVLSAGGANVVQFSDLSISRIAENLNLILTDNESLATVRKKALPGTLIARHFFLRDVLLKNVDVGDVSKYLYSTDVHSQGATRTPQPIIVDLDSATPSRGVAPPSTPATARRPATLRRRNQTRANNSNASSSQDIIVIDDDTTEQNKIKISQSTGDRKPVNVSDVVVINDEADEQNSNHLSLHSRKKLKFDSEEIVEMSDMNRVDPVSSSTADDDDDIILISSSSSSEAQWKSSKVLKHSVNTEIVKIDDDDCCIMDDVPPSTIKPPTAIKTEIIDKCARMNDTNKQNLHSTKDLSNCSGPLFTSQSSNSSTATVESVQVQNNSEISVNAQESKTHSVKELSNVIEHDKERTGNNAVVPKQHLTQDDSTKVNIKPSSQSIKDINALKNFSNNITVDTDILSDSKENVNNFSNNISSNISQSSKISKSATLQIIGQYLEHHCPFRDIFCSVPRRNSCFSSSKLVKREERKTDASLYWSSIRSSSGLGINVSDMNSLSVIRNSQDNRNDDSSTQEKRTDMVDENDSDVVLNSLLWLKLTITPIHYPNSELLGDMLARYVIKCGIPAIQSETLSLAQFVVSMQPPDSSSVTCNYYMKVFQTLASVSISRGSCSLPGNSRTNSNVVPVGDSLWTIVNAVCDALNIDCEGGETSSAKAARHASFERWQYENNLFSLLDFVASTLHLDLNKWKKSKTSIGEMLPFRVLFGYSNNPAVLSKSSMKLVNLWIFLAPSKCDHSIRVKLRHTLLPFIGLMFELIWLWNYQRQIDCELTKTPDKGCKSKIKSMDLADIMRGNDVRFTPLSTQMVLAFKGLNCEDSLSLLCELPEARHRLFLSEILKPLEVNKNASLIEPSKDNTAQESLLHVLVNNLKETAKCCKDLETDDSKPSTNKSTPSVPTLPHHIDSRVIIFQMQSYIQLTGIAFVVNKAISENVKQKRLFNNSAASGTSSNGVKRNSEGNSLVSVSNPVEERTFYNIFGYSYKREYLFEFFKRFTFDHKVLSDHRFSLYELTRSCAHVKELRLFLSLLYVKEK